MYYVINLVMETKKERKIEKFIFMFVNTALWGSLDLLT